MQELVTVIIPVYKVENYIDRCMESVLAQSHENLEIILVDDGSPDECGEICDKYARMDKRVSVIHKTNGGLSSARNAALDVMKGKWVVCIDSDDYVHKDYVKRLYEAATSNNADISICSHYQEKEDKLSITGRIIDEVKIYDNMEALFRLVEDDEIKSYAWGKLYKAELFEGVRYPDGRNYEDIATTYYLFDKAKKIVKIPDYLYFYIIRDDSISFNKSRQMWHKGCHASCLGQQERCEYFKKKGYDELYLKAQAKLLPYLYSDISSGYSDGAAIDIQKTKEYIGTHKDEFCTNPYVSYKDKKIIGVYLKSESFFEFYTWIKQYLNRINRILRKSRVKVKTAACNQGFVLSKGKKKRLVYFELPCFDNLGDHAIAYSAEKILKEFCDDNSEYQLYVVDGWDVDKSVSALSKCVSTEDVVVCQGGGNLGSLYDFAEVLRRKVFKKLKNSRIILMPQTCYYSEDKAGIKALLADKKAISGCRDITLFARDKKSLEFMKENFDAKSQLMHDTVSLNRPEIASYEDREGIVVCLRSDREGKLNKDDKKNIMDICESSGKVLVTDTCTNHDISSSEREFVLKAKWEIWKKHKLVVTDRLHGMVFAIITETPCIVIGNDHFKVFEAYKTFADCEYIEFVENLAGLQEVVDKMLALDIKAISRISYENDIKVLFDAIKR